ncbi:MAG: hypothetical protein VKJ24_01005 [Synechococcales bacterium]|nr:hypothetical protein [Synechococcales bacterium]
MTFQDLIEGIQSLSMDEKWEIHLLLQQYLREERREEMYVNALSAQVEQQRGELQFSSNIQELKQLIED